MLCNVIANVKKYCAYWLELCLYRKRYRSDKMKKTLVNVSEIICSAMPDNSYSYGFTVTFEDGNILNITQISVYEKDQEVMRALSQKRNKYLKQIINNG